MLPRSVFALGAVSVVLKSLMMDSDACCSDWISFESVCTRNELGSVSRITVQDLECNQLPFFLGGTTKYTENIVTP